MSAPNQFFVYGTLKRGLRYESVWPVTPLNVQQAWTRGSLYAGTQYPAMKAGVDRVLGELWSFDTAQCPVVLHALDMLEGTHDNSPDDLYHRIVTEAFDLSGQSLGDAHGYHFVRNPLSCGFTRIVSEDDNYVAWPADS